MESSFMQPIEPEGVAARRAEIGAWVAAELAVFESDLERLRRDLPLLQRSAHHLLALPGKRVRPICVVLAAKLGTGFGPAARQMALAVELIHHASLLHDDVIDLGDSRRGAPAARVLYGNAASVIAGNWLLTTALQRVARSDLPDMLPQTLATIAEMVEAEALQLANRGRIRIRREEYFRVVEGKTAALFRWALYAGARAGGLPRPWCRALELFGKDVGVAFQLVDDILDLTGDAKLTGKTLFSDLREGKMTYPLLLALDRDPTLERLVEEILARPSSVSVPDVQRARVQKSMLSHGVAQDCRLLARRKIDDAVCHLRSIPALPGRDALITLAEAIVDRVS